MHRSILRLFFALFLLAAVGTLAASADSPTFHAHLAGRNEVPAVNTLAQGQAFFKRSDDGTAL